MAWEDDLLATGYEGIMFPALDVGESGGHDSVAHRALGRRGADVETTGMRPYDFKFSAAFLIGLDGHGVWDDDLWPRVYGDFIAKLESTPKGTLSHPLRGPVKVHIDKWTTRLDPNVRNGVFVDFECTEDRGDADLYLLRVRNHRGDPADAVAARAAEVDEQGPASTEESVSAQVERILQVLAQGEQTFRDVQTATTQLTALAQGKLADADLGIGSHGYRLALEQLIVESNRLKEAYIGLTQPREFTVPDDMSLSAIAALPLVYGDPSKVGLLHGANRVPRPERVPMGTVLVVPRVL